MHQSKFAERQKSAYDVAAIVKDTAEQLSQGSLRQDQITEARALVKAMSEPGGVVHDGKSQQPVIVCVMLRVMRLFDFDVASQSFKVKLHVIMTWIAKGEAAVDALTDAEITTIKEINSNPENTLCYEPDDGFIQDGDPEVTFTQVNFRPRMRIGGLVEGKQTLRGDGDGEEYFHRSVIDGQTIIRWEVEKIAKISAKLDLRNYPVDCQMLPVSIEMKTPVAEAMFIPFPEEVLASGAVMPFIGEVHEVNVPHYDVMEGHEFTSHLYLTQRNSWRSSNEKNKQHHSGVCVAIWVSRQPVNDITNICLVQFFITSLVACVWAVLPANISDRLACDFVLLLSSITMKQIVMGRLPPVAYVTFLEHYLNFAFGMLVLATMLHTCAYRLINHLNLSTQLELYEGTSADTLQFIMFLVIWAAVNFYFYYRGKLIQAAERKRVIKLGQRQIASGDALGENFKLHEQGEEGVNPLSDIASDTFDTDK